MEQTFVERCEDWCALAGLVLTDDERLQIAEMEFEGLIPSQAPKFIRAIRSRAA